MAAPARLGFTATGTLPALQWVKSDLVDWRTGQPAGYQEWQLSIAVTRFDNGWMMACIFSPDEAPANCRAYDRDPTLPALDAP